MPRQKDIFCARFLYKINSSLYVIDTFRKYLMPRTRLYISALFADGSFYVRNLLKSPVIESDDGRLRVYEHIYHALHAENGSGKPVDKNDDAFRLFWTKP